MIINKKGDLLDYFRNDEVGCICHVTNCQGVMGSGIAFQIKNEFPEAYEAYKEDERISEGLKLGNVSFSENDHGIIFNMNAQHLYGAGDRFLNYEAFYNCLESVRDTYDIYDGVKPLGFPKLVGCDRAGGSWRVVKAMIDDVFKDHEVLIVEYDTSEKSKYGYMCDEQDVEDWIDSIVGEFYGTSSHIAISAFEKWIQTPDCDKSDLKRIKNVVDKYVD